jgi:transposase
LQRVDERLGISPETLHGWVRRAEVDPGEQARTTTSDAARLAELEREIKDLRQPDAILRRASAFFATQLDRPSWSSSMTQRTPGLVRVEPAWTELQVALSSYYTPRTGNPRGGRPPMWRPRR